MTLYQSKTALGITPVPTPNGSGLSDLVYKHTVVGALAAGDIIDMGPIEPGVEPVDTILISDDLDSNGAPTITLSVGILNAGKTDLNSAGETFIAASTVGQTGGVARATTANTYLAGASSSERRLGVKVVAGPATAASDGKKIAVVLSVNS